MDESQPWQTLAQLLRRARAELAPGSSREAFARDRGASLRIMADLETAARDNYEPQTLINAETWYGLAPGQIAAVLRAADDVRREAGRLEVHERRVEAAREDGDEGQLKASSNQVVIARRKLADLEAELELRLAQRGTPAPAVSAPDQDVDGVLLDLPDETLDGLSPVEREEVIAAARLAALKKAREIKAGAQVGLFTVE